MNRQLPIKRWTLAGASVLALLLVGPTYTKYHKPGPVIGPTPVAPKAAAKPAFIDDEKSWPTPIASPLPPKADNVAPAVAEPVKAAPVKKSAPKAPAKKKRRK